MDVTHPRMRVALTAFVALLAILSTWMWLPERAPADAQVMLEDRSEPETLEPMPPGTVSLGIEIRRGSTLGGLLSEHSLPANAIREAGLPHYDLARIRPGRELMVVYTSGQERPHQVSYQIDEDRTLVVFRDEGGWDARLDEVEFDVGIGVRDLVLERSLWADGLDAGLRPVDLVRLARIFEYELDFNSELRKGARFSLVADELTAEGRDPRLGTIHAARIENAGDVSTAIRFEVEEDEEAYFEPDGRSMRRPFLRSPLEFSRVTSGFNPDRFHPILEERRPHRGVDFGAPTGTPVRAVADGRVRFAGRRGGYGKHVEIVHDDTYTTSYSHLNKIRVRRGQRVRQSDVIGDVGMTGMATGPHLHYEMHVNGRHVDPMAIELPRAVSLPDRARADFQREVDRWLPKLPGASR